MNTQDTPRKPIYSGNLPLKYHYRMLPSCLAMSTLLATWTHILSVYLSDDNMTPSFSTSGYYTSLPVLFIYLRLALSLTVIIVSKRFLTSQSHITSPALLGIYIAFLFYFLYTLCDWVVVGIHFRITTFTLHSIGLFFFLAVFLIPLIVLIYLLVKLVKYVRKRLRVKRGLPPQPRRLRDRIARWFRHCFSTYVVGPLPAPWTGFFAGLCTGILFNLALAAMYSNAPLASYFIWITFYIYVCMNHGKKAPFRIGYRYSWYLIITYLIMQFIVYYCYNVFPYNILYAVWPGNVGLLLYQGIFHIGIIGETICTLIGIR